MVAYNDLWAMKRHKSFQNEEVACFRGVTVSHLNEIVHSDSYCSCFLVRMEVLANLSKLIWPTFALAWSFLIAFDRIRNDDRRRSSVGSSGSFSLLG